MKVTAAKFESVITRFLQPSGTLTSQLAEELVTETFHYEHVNKECALNENFIKSLDEPTRYSVRRYCEGMEKSNVHDVSIHTALLFTLRRHDLVLKKSTLPTINQRTQRKKPSSSRKSAVNAVQNELTSSPSTFVGRTLRTPVVAMNIIAQSSPSDIVSDPIANPDALSITNSAAYCRACLYGSHTTSRYIFVPKNKRQLLTRLRDFIF